MKKYKTLEMRLIFFLKQDIITNSITETVDDLGAWNYEWFAQDND